MKNLRARLTNTLHRAMGRDIPRTEVERIADAQFANLGLMEQEAREQAKAESEGREKRRTTADAEAAELARIGAILRSPEAASQWDAALGLALDSDVSALEARAVLREVYQATPQLPSLARAGHHNLGPNLSREFDDRDLEHHLAASVLNSGGLRKKR